MKAVLQAYIDAFNRGDAEAIVALYAEDATVEDPVGSPPKRGRQAILEFYREAIATGGRIVLDSPMRGSHGDAAAMAFSVHVGPMTVRVIDTMTFDASGRITQMRAYFGPDDFVQ
jgi:steroid delta-isomerase